MNQFEAELIKQLTEMNFHLNNMRLNLIVLDDINEILKEIKEAV